MQSYKDYKDFLRKPLENEPFEELVVRRDIYEGAVDSYGEDFVEAVADRREKTLGYAI